MVLFSSLQSQKCHSVISGTIKTKYSIRQDKLTITINSEWKILKRFEPILKMDKLTHFEKDLVKCKNCGREVMFLKMHFRYKQYKMCESKYTKTEIAGITEASRELRRRNKNCAQRQL